MRTTARATALPAARNQRTSDTASPASPHPLHKQYTMASCANCSDLEAQLDDLRKEYGKLQQVYANECRNHEHTKWLHDALQEVMLSEAARQREVFNKLNASGVVDPGSAAQLGKIRAGGCAHKKEGDEAREREPGKHSFRRLRKTLDVLEENRPVLKEELGDMIEEIMYVRLSARAPSDGYRSSPPGGRWNAESTSCS